MPDSTGSTLALFDLDDLAGVNRQHDFDTGDRLLNAVADVLQRSLQPSATLERLESGRFLVRSRGTCLEDAAVEAERLRQIAACVQVQGTTGSVTRMLTVGVVAVSANESRARAILRADVALTNAKRAGGNQTQTVLKQPTPSVVPSRAVLAEAVRTRALEYHVQPIVRLADRQTVGVESLLRWNRPDGTIEGPAGFLDTLNRLPEAGVDVLPELAIAAARPFVEGPSPIYATFNITGAVLDGQGSPACCWLNKVLDALPPENLIVEIVETAIIVAPERAADMIERMRARGVRIALDDFGSGLSNLERLRRYPVDILKIDRAFVSGIGTTGREEAILHALVSLSREMDINLITEGIETEEQVQTLMDIGVQYGQGYHLGRPGPAMDWANRLTR
ncbi:bifunctional diguanylate cyclase/phosphodiesterase [Jannaschia faecimaris]|uniref:bifunctional diguanylate cyclase/phosphodiesterase n=1 Tax=Jannaschia faecimaris TaxID=1244108 RepID=UPI00147A69E2|nr:bifunctional diguanylate cyclase/phosphodiesterase [Jannaschia faecimaris]